MEHSCPPPANQPIRSPKDLNKEKGGALLSNSRWTNKPQWNTTNKQRRHLYLVVATGNKTSMVHLDNKIVLILK